MAKTETAILGTSAGMGSGARAAVVIVGRWDRFLPRRVGDISMSIADFVRMHAAGFEEGGSPA